ncbi:hypothetical protein POX_f08344 [Penicillium oxalicum]|uniref:hypothetical protein n=1 Tax=Penicillium oxalicum TaxID=69781 RepID=UPI0020B65D97|nr:hypothetical protein POX_f08344 [Penicillium oxalicum]KAI2787962.1 hypothetical protein POX_f08344 [Penicillium oxalicum]
MIRLLDRYIHANRDVDREHAERGFVFSPIFVSVFSEGPWCSRLVWIGLEDDDFGGY